MALKWVGGEAGGAFDHCYHQLCDDMDNLNLTGFDEMSDAAATALMTFAWTKKPVTATGSTARGGKRVNRKVTKQRLARKTFRGSHAQR